MEHPWGKEIQFCSNEVPRVMYNPAQGLKLVYMHSNIKEMLKQFSKIAAPNRTIFSMDHL